MDLEEEAYGSLHDKQKARQIAHKVMGLAEDFRRTPYPLSPDMAVQLAAFAWMAKEIERAVDVIVAHSERNVPDGSNFSAPPGTSAPETVREGILH